MNRGREAKIKTESESGTKKKKKCIQSMHSNKSLFVKRVDKERESEREREKERNRQIWWLVSSSTQCPAPSL